MKTISRRSALTAISGSVCAAISIPRVDRAAFSSLSPVLGGPQLVVKSGRPAVGAFTKSQLETLAALSETIIPADEHSPGAKAAAVDQFIDEIVGTSDQKTKDFWIAGLTAVENLARGQCGKTFAACRPKEQFEIVGKMSAAEANPSTVEERFFVAVKRATIEGYYNSEIGIHQELHYQGNTFLPEFKGCVHSSRAG